MLAPANASPAGLNPSNLEVYNGQLLFEGISKRVNGVGGYQGLFTTDGTAAGTQEITPAAGVYGDTSGKPYPYGFTPTDLTALRPESDPPTVTSSILWQNTSTGQASIWDMDGSTLVGGGAVSANPGPSWTEIGTGDFNHDGLSDILWRNASTGQASIWEMNGNTLLGGGAVSANPGLAWTAIGTGDFNEDGFSDILWRNTSTGQASIWEMKGTTLMGGGAVSANPGLAWTAIGTGDFNQRRLLRHPVAEREHRPGLDLGNERQQLDRRRPGDPQSRAELASDRDRRFQPGRLFRHPVSEQKHGPGLGLGDGRDELDRRRAGQRQSRAELARHRNRRRRFRHPSSKHQRPSLDLGDERKHDHPAAARSAPIPGRAGTRSA